MAFEIRAGALLAGKLRLVRQLGQGGMGVVWAAHHESLDTDVAVKLIRPERVIGSSASLARFEIEAKTTARITHPNVVQVMDYGTVDDSLPFIVMELLDGFSLAELLESGGRLSWASTQLLVQQVGGALASAHDRGIVHRDIKPHNVFIVRQSADDPLFVKVLDFGIAKLLGDSQVPGAGHTLTETGAIVGSPPYMSPEQIEGRKDVDLRSDLWSLAVIVYEVLTGKRPFEGSSFVGVGKAILDGKYAPASELRKGLPRSVDDFLAKALSVDAEGRFASAREMVTAFQSLDAPLDEDEDGASLERSSPVAAFATTVEAPEPVAAASRTLSHAPAALRVRPKKRRRVLVPAVGAAVLLAVGVGWSAFRAKGPGVCPAGMKRIEGATFRMGTVVSGETRIDETPAHSVTLQSFCLDTTEVRVAEYVKCASCSKLPGTLQGGDVTPNSAKFWGTYCNGVEAGDHPANCLDFEDATHYCETQGKRLPTEEEWELAARGPKGSTFPWGEAPPTAERINACGEECSGGLNERFAKTAKAPWPSMYAGDDGALATAAVGTHPAGATPSGILDLAGNVWEWTSSRYCRYDMPDCAESRRVTRGGGWSTVESEEVRAARRSANVPSDRSPSVGFRCAKSL